MRESPVNGADFSGNRPGGLRRDELIDLCGLVGFLRKQHPHSTAYHVQAVTGIPARTVECWFEGRARPSFGNAMQLAIVYGPAFLSAALRHAPAWLDEAHRADEARRVDEEIKRLEERKDRLRRDRCGKLSNTA